MRWSLFLGRVSGIKVFIHWTFLILIGYLIISNARVGKDTSEIILSVGFVLSVFACVFLHELGHAIAARRFNIKTQDITMLPIGGVARLEKMPEEPKQELIVALAGPLVNVVIAGLIYLYLSIWGFSSSDVSLVNVGSGNFMESLMMTNVVLVAFNLIPAFPMDGGRVLRALLSFRLPATRATRIAATIGQLLAIVFVFAGFFGNPMLIFIGFFIFLGAQAESGVVQTKSLLQGYKVSDVLMHDFRTLNVNDPISKGVHMLLDGQSKDFLVLNDGAVAGTLSRSDIIRALTATGEQTLVFQAMNPAPKFLKTNDLLEDIYPELQAKNASILPVVDEQNNLVGVLDGENLTEFLMVKKALENEG